MTVHRVRPVDRRMLRGGHQRGGHVAVPLLQQELPHLRYGEVGVALHRPFKGTPTEDDAVEVLMVTRLRRLNVADRV